MPSCSRMYLRIASTSYPTVDTAYPLAQKFSPLKFLCLPCMRAMAIADFPFRNPITKASSAWEEFLCTCGRGRSQASLPQFYILFALPIHGIPSLIASICFRRLLFCDTLAQRRHVPCSPSLSGINSDRVVKKKKDVQ